MATGFNSRLGGVMAPTDVAGAGYDAWAATTGIPATSTVVGGAGDVNDENRMPYDVDRSRGRIVTTDTRRNGPAGGDAANLLDDWRDVFNIAHSPAPWILLIALVVLGLMQFRVQTRVGRRKASLAVG
jgi:hypothetical protein